MITQTIASKPALDIFTSLDPSAIAVLLDVDGTIIDIGASPYEVEVPAALRTSLERLFVSTGGALALVSGRPIVDLDHLFAPLKLPAIGGHGAEMRLRADEERPPPLALSENLRRCLAEAALFDSGVVVEDKGYSLALHYRQALHCAERLRKHVAACRAAFPGEPTELLLGKAMFEVKRPGINKGDAVRELIRHPPFAGRVPVFIGDDVTDESVFAIMPALGGKSFSVKRHSAGLDGMFESPAQVRLALQRLAAPEARP